jgi:uncharacterized protein with HEPN domain
MTSMNGSSRKHQQIFAMPPNTRFQPTGFASLRSARLRVMREPFDRLIHGYFGVDYGIVWDVVKNKIPILHQAIKEVVEAESTQ